MLTQLHYATRMLLQTPTTKRQSKWHADRTALGSRFLPKPCAAAGGRFPGMPLRHLHWSGIKADAVILACSSPERRRVLTLAMLTGQ